MKPVTLKAGETTTIVIELDFERENITKDWSLTAWAAKGAVEVRHSDGLAKDSFPFIQKKGDASMTQSTENTTTTTVTTDQT